MGNKLKLHAQWILGFSLSCPTWDTDVLILKGADGSQFPLISVGVVDAQHLWKSRSRCLTLDIQKRRYQKSVDTFENATLSDLPKVTQEFVAQSGTRPRSSTLKLQSPTSYPSSLIAKKFSSSTNDQIQIGWFSSGKDIVKRKLLKSSL